MDTLTTIGLYAFLFVCAICFLIGGVTFIAFLIEKIAGDPSDF